MSHSQMCSLESARPGPEHTRIICSEDDYSAVVSRFPSLRAASDPYAPQGTVVLVTNEEWWASREGLLNIVYRDGRAMLVERSGPYSIRGPRMEAVGPEIETPAIRFQRRICVAQDGFDDSVTCRICDTGVRAICLAGYPPPREASELPAVPSAFKNAMLNELGRLCRHAAAYRDEAVSP